MPVLHIRLDVDRTGGFDALKELPDAEIIHLSDDAYVEIGTLRHGMVSGKDSVAFCFKLPDGRVAVIETSAELFLAAAGGIGAWQEGRRDRGED
jgi:hypothetical protein